MLRQGNLLSRVNQDVNNVCLEALLTFEGLFILNGSFQPVQLESIHLQMLDFTSELKAGIEETPKPMLITAARLFSESAS